MRISDGSDVCSSDLLGAPHWRPQARGLIHGLSGGSTRAHLARAELEAIAHSQCDILDAMAADTGAPLRDIRVDGGAATNNLLLHMHAALTGLSMPRPPRPETPQLVSAQPAGLG